MNDWRKLLCLSSVMPNASACEDSSASPPLKFPTINSPARPGRSLRSRSPDLLACGAASDDLNLNLAAYLLTPGPQGFTFKVRRLLACEGRISQHAIERQKGCLQYASSRDISYDSSSNNPGMSKDFGISLEMLRNPSHASAQSFRTTSQRMSLISKD